VIQVSLVNQEDSIIMNQSSIDLGLFVTTSYRTVTDSEKKRGNYITETICVPPQNSGKNIKDGEEGYFRRRNGNYSMLDKDGIIKKGVLVKQGDILIGKIAIKSTKNGDVTKTDCSTAAKAAETGIVDRIYSRLTPNGYRLVKIVMRQHRIPEPGDKLASRAAQKGTVGISYRREDMPFNRDGISPDLIINPHCLTGDTIIELADGDSEYIKNIYDKNIEIVTIDPVTLKKSITTFTDGFVKNTDTLNKITTTSGREIKCTPEHLLLTLRNNSLTWIESSKLISYSDKLIVTHSIDPLPKNDGINLIIEKQSGIYWDKLEKVGLTGEIPHHKTKILARLIGALDSDGHITNRNIDSGSVRCMLHLGELQDYNEVCYDMNILGMKKPSCLKTTNCYRVELEVSLGVLLKYLGACLGNKCKTIRIFPEWINQMSSSIKREFLSGYHGGDGSKVVVNQKTKQQQIRIRGTRCRSYITVKESHKKYLKSIMTLFEEFDIKTTLQEYKCKENESDRVDLMIYFPLEQSNLLKIASTIAYRYCNHKRRESVIAIEYLKSRLNGMSFTYKKFVDCFTYKGHVTSFVESIQTIDNEQVYDFTTVSNNHSFIANGIVSHNCLPSRMTVNQLMETTLGKSCLMEGTFGDATPFTSSSLDSSKQICDRLAKHGYERTGWEYLTCGITGQPIKAKVFMGPTYYQRLKHMVADKIHSRSQGNVTMLTRQPLEGRSRDGGLRFGKRLPKWGKIYISITLIVSFY
jgi:intein/homing endonuclease